MLDRLWARLFGRRESFDDERVRHAFVDGLTALPTRHVMAERLREARAAGITGVAAMIDIDHFKQINDRHGHATGDGVLQAVADRFRAEFGSPAWAARVGGDEFFVLLPGADMAEARCRIVRCAELLRAPIVCGEHSVENLTMSVGLATFPAPTNDELLKAVDVAMYAAKARGRDGVVVFDDDTRKIVTARRELASVIVELQERNRALRDDARTDALTGLRNRLALDEVLDVVVGGSDPRFAAAAVAFIDIDHFGDYNHLHGDAAGDEALRRVAAAVRGCSRDADLVFRKGGEELVVVLAGAGHDESRVAAERLRACVQALAIDHAGSKTAPVMTVTVGVASGGASGTLRALMIAASDEAMRAKVDHARNRVHAASL